MNAPQPQPPTPSAPTRANSAAFPGPRYSPIRFRAPSQIDPNTLHPFIPASVLGIFFASDGAHYEPAFPLPNPAHANIHQPLPEDLAVDAHSAAVHIFIVTTAHPHPMILRRSLVQPLPGAPPSSSEELAILFSSLADAVAFVLLEGDEQREFAGEFAGGFAAGLRENPWGAKVLVPQPREGEDCPPEVL